MECSPTLSSQALSKISVEYALSELLSPILP